MKVSGSTYIPLDNQVKIEKKLDNIIKKSKKITDPFEQSFFLLVHLSYLQGFIDVNKRTARLVCNIPFIKKNLVPLSFNAIEIEDYRSAMIVIYEFNEIEPLSDLYTWSYFQTVKHYKTSVDSMSVNTIRVQYRQQRREFVRFVIDKMLTKKSVIQQALHDYTLKNIAKCDQKKFQEEALHDVFHLDVFKLPGLGVSKTDYFVWRARFEK